ncbi:interferon-gamma-inducible GTPase 10-like, partial [Trichomycterus rosablanca]|uniref:interferon-gamma-inducible GTPase 10-like n=1 Tax=Trichomycterus rosablanca TaxID=2290929 RepID=UPI002F352D74
TVTMSQDSDVTAILEASGESTLERAYEKAQEKQDQLNNVSLDVAVTGESGAGKSTFINAIRGLRDDDEGAAATGVTETTTEPTPYLHPTMPNVTFWDLPGIGTKKFKVKKYLKKMQFARYDFFIIISSGRLGENDVLLAKKIKKKKKLFYFVRSKIDVDVAQEEKKRDFNREETLAKIRNDCLAHLKDFKNPKVFLISSYDDSAFDFEELEGTLMSELPEHKRYALIESVPVTSVAILKRKVRMFKIAAWVAAASSGGVAAALVPDLTLACDVGILVTFFTSCYFSFGLDDESIESLSKRVNKPHLTSLKKSSLVEALVSKSATRLDEDLPEKYRRNLKPGVVNAVAAGYSFNSTYKLLKSGLEELEADALMILREAGLE